MTFTVFCFLLAGFVCTYFPFCGGISIVRRSRMRNWPYAKSVFLAGVWHLVMSSLLLATLWLGFMEFFIASKKYPIGWAMAGGCISGLTMTATWVLYVFWTRGIVDIKSAEKS